MNFVIFFCRWIFIAFCLLFLIYQSTGSNAEKIDSGVDQNPKFTRVHVKRGLDFTGYLGHSASWGDFNNDGCLDLLVTNTDSNDHPNTYLFKNLCNGKFAEMRNFGIIEKFPVRSSAWADYDNDGYLDLVIGGIDVYTRPFLYNNLYGLLFDEKAAISGILNEGFGNNFAWADYNLDGLVDLVETGSNLNLYLNQGSSGFSEMSYDSGIYLYGNGVNSAIWVDYNNDKYPDLLLLRRKSNVLLKNNRDGTFSDVTEESGIGGEEAWNSVAACSGDIDNDGYFDIYIVNIGSPRNALYKNNGNGTFSDITVESGTADVGDGRTCAFVDYDSDGLIDIFTTNHIHPSRMFKNLGNENFRDTAPELGLDSKVDVFSSAWGDFNGDAKMDVFLNGHIDKGLYVGSNNNNSVNIELVGNGTDTNKSAIGSRILLSTGDSSQIREVSGGRGCCEQDMLPVNFGLGSENMFSFTVNWTNGKICRFENLIAGDARIYKVWQNGCKVKAFYYTH